MKCLICNADAVAQLTPGQWLETRCNSGCGNFRVSINLVERLSSCGEHFNILRTRKWLQEARIKSSTPKISNYDYSVSLLQSDEQ